MSSATMALGAAGEDGGLSSDMVGAFVQLGYYKVAARYSIRNIEIER